MVARASHEEQQQRRRKKLLRGLLLSGAAVGVPALMNAVLARRNRSLDSPRWGRGHQYAWHDGEISFQRLGSGEPILLLHSFGPGHDSEEWRLAAELLATGYQVFAPDLLGWGRSDKPRQTYDAELYIQLISDFIEDVIGGRVTLCGAGLTGAYAVQIAADRPDLVRGVALSVPHGLEAGGDEPDLKDALIHRLLKLPIVGTSTLNVYTSQTALQHYLRREVYAAPERVDASVVEHHYRSSHQPGGHHALAAYLSGYLNHSAEGALERVQRPLCVVWGREATSPPVETADLWLRELPGAEIEVIEESGSLPHLEVPAEYVKRLRRFLSDSTAAEG